MPTSYYATVQLSCDAEVVDDPDEKAAILPRQLAHFEPAGGYLEPDAGHEHFRRRLPGIRGLRLTVTSVRAKFKYGGNKEPAHRELLAEHLAERDGPADAAAREHLLRRPAGRAVDRSNGEHDLPGGVAGDDLGEAVGGPAPAACWCR